MEDNIVNFSDGIRNQEKKKDFTAKTTKIAQNVISRLEQEDIPIFADSFESVFEQLIADESEEFKNIFGQKVDINLEAKDRLLSFESSVKDGIKNVKNILDITKSIYQSVVTTQNAIHQKSQELTKIDNPVAFKSAVQLYSQDFTNLQITLETQIVQMRQAIKKIVVNIDNVSKNSIYDTHYNVYNRRYFLSHCKKEKRLLDQINCPYAFVGFSLTKGYLESLRDKKLIKLSLKAMATVLCKESQSDEALCYFGNGKFMMLYKYIDNKKVLERVRKIIASAKENSFVLNGKMTLDFCAGVRFALPSANLSEEIERCAVACDKAFHGMIDIEINHDGLQEKIQEFQEEKV
ncbi:hypothetical protein [Helicobacter cholecystus]|uniref:hypothetical protein n=1 Tax=Helicobacter cholecystus TaxID=45498 RepID=UPI002738C41C|nr:hypothetical protein [Helicobacter cholecystus]